jgi:hypothetical protein
VLREGVKEELNVHMETLSKKHMGMPSNVGSSKNAAFKYLRTGQSMEKRFLASKYLRGGDFDHVGALGSPNFFDVTLQTTQGATQVLSANRGRAST